MTAPWLWMLVLSGLLGTAALLAHTAWRGAQHGHPGWAAAAPAGLSGLLLAAALLIAVRQQPVWGVGELLVTIMVTVAHFASDKPLVRWSSR